MGIFNPISIGILLVNLALAYHSIRTGRSPAWLLALAVASFVGFLYTIAIWIIYVAVAVVPDLLKSHGARRFADNMVQVADPGRVYREKKRQVELVGSVDAKRALAEESLKRGLFADAIELYEGAMQGPIGQDDPALIKGLARARMLSGDGAAAEALYLKLRALDPAAFDADAELDYARALVLQNKHYEAVRQYESVVSRYPGEEARARFGLLLQSMGQHDRAQALFTEILASVKGAPGYYRRRQKEWTAIARQNLR